MPDYKPASTLTTRFDTELLETLRALAWYRRTSQRAILEKGLATLIEQMDPDELANAIQAYRESQSDD